MKTGWLQRQLQHAAKTVATFPNWMRNHERTIDDMKTIRDIIGGILHESRIAALEARDAELKQRWTEEYEAMKKQVAELRARLRLHEEKAQGEYWVWQGDGHDHLESLVCPILIPAETFRQRDADERERVTKVVLETPLPVTVDIRNKFLAAIYPLPEPAKLAAGIYSVENVNERDACYRYFPAPFVPQADCVYRRLVYADEVMGKAEPSAMEQSCCNANADYHACDCPKADPKPTFEEWCNEVGYTGATSDCDALKAAMVKKGMVRP